MEISPQFEHDLQPQHSDAEDAFHVILTRSKDPIQCSFWISLYKQGSVTSPQFLRASSLEEAFSILSEKGLAETRPLMLSDNSDSKHRQYFLLPEEIFQTNPIEAKSLILSTLKDLAQDKVGFYFCPSVVGLDQSVRTIADILRGLSLLRTREAHLYTGEIGVSKLLNAALSVKEEIRGHRDVWIFH